MARLCLKLGVGIIHSSYTDALKAKKAAEKEKAN